MIFLEIFNRQIQKKESPYSYICLQLGSLTCRRMINFFKSFHILFTPNLAISSCGWSPLWLYYKIWRKKKTLLRTCKNVGTKQTLVKAWPIFVSTLQFITFIIGWEGFCMNQHLHWYHSRNQCCVVLPFKENLQSKSSHFTYNLKSSSGVGLSPVLPSFRPLGLGLSTFFSNLRISWPGSKNQSGSVDTVQTLNARECV